MNYAPCQVSLIKDRKIEGQKMTVEKNERTRTGREQPLAVCPGNTRHTHTHKRQEKNEKTQVIVSAALQSVGLQPSDSHLLPCSVKEMEGKETEGGNLRIKKNGKRKMGKDCKRKGGVKKTE